MTVVGAAAAALEQNRREEKGEESQVEWPKKCREGRLEERAAAGAGRREEETETKQEDWGWRGERVKPRWEDGAVLPTPASMSVRGRREGQ